MKKVGFLNKIIFIINNIIAIMLLLSLFVPYIKPSSFSMAPIFGLITPALILINILFIFYWIVIGFRKQFLLSAFVLTIGYFFSTPIYKFSSRAEDNFENQLTIMSYNVRKFNMYNWIKDDSIPQKICNFIHKKYPDIVALQEFKEDKRFKLNYPYYSNPLVGNYDDPVMNSKFRTHLAIYSKYPIINEQVIKYDLRVMAIYADIVKNSDTIRVYNFHLHSLGIAPEEDFLGHQDSESLLKLLSASMKNQEVQLNQIIGRIEDKEYRTIVICDMNNTAYSWVYKKTKDKLKDTFLKAGKGFGKTYSFNGFPLRIDYILVDEKLKVNQHKNYNIKYSDHYPIMATVSF